MNFIENVLFLINKNGISKNKMLKDLGLAKGSISNWQERGTIPSGETLSKIATYFGVSTDYLLGNEQKEKPIADRDELSELLKSPEMKEIYNNLILLSQEGIEKVRDFVKFQREQEKK